MEKIPMSAPDLDESDIQEVLEVLMSGHLALGMLEKEKLLPEVFEEFLTK